MGKKSKQSKAPVLQNPTTVDPVSIVKFDGKLHQLADTPFGRMGLPCGDNAEEHETICQHDLPLVPLSLFYSIADWQRAIAKEYACESSTSLFLIDGKWVAEPFYQQNTRGSMTIDVDFNSDKNQPLLDKFYEKTDRGIHMTIHNHVKSAAFQSGTDDDDETGLPGPHITLGKMEEKVLDYHGRFSVMVGGKHYFVPMRLSDIIECPLPPDASWSQVDLSEKMVLTETPEVGWPKEWKDRFTIEPTTTVVGGHRAPMGSGPGKPTTSPKTTTSTTSARSTAEEGASSSPRIGLKLLKAEELDIEQTPWCLILPMDCTAWPAFKASAVDNDNYNKALANILAAHNCSMYDIFTTLANAKTLANIPLDSAVQEA